MTAVSVMVHLVAESRLYYCSADTDRWAEATLRDAPDDRSPSWAVEFSDGRRMAGEMSRYFVERRAVDWVREGNT